MKKSKTAKAKKTTAKAKKTAPKKTQGAKAGSKKDPMKKKTVKLEERTRIIGIFDRSGSMRPVVQDAIGGINTFVAEQKKLKDKATYSAVLFDDQYEPMFEGKVIDINDVPEITDRVFVPRGMTALFDAIGKSVQGYKASAITPNEKVLVLIVTDGAENASKEFNQKDIADLIAYQKTQGWQFIFMCSTEDTYKVSQDLNINVGNTFKFDNNSQGNKKMYSKLAKATASYRSMTLDYALSDEGSLKVANLVADTDDED